MYKSITHVIYDMDGLLLDTESLHEQVNSEIARRYGKTFDKNIKIAIAGRPTLDSWFSDHEYGFTPHDLRHAYNHRGHQSGFNPKALADSLGHSMTMNSTGYLRHMSDEVKLQGIRDAMSKEQNKRSENEILREENKALKAKNKALENKIELLETRLQLNQTLKES